MKDWLWTQSWGGSVALQGGEAALQSRRDDELKQLHSSEAERPRDGNCSYRRLLPAWRCWGNAAGFLGTVWLVLPLWAGLGAPWIRHHLALEDAESWPRAWTPKSLGALEEEAE